jgi:hypothetical protein
VGAYTKGLFFPLVAGGVFMAAFEVCGAWFDIARVDMLGLAAILGAIALSGRHSKPAAFYAGSSLLGLSYFIKQTNLALIAGVIIVWILWDRRRAFHMLIIAASIIGIGILVLNWTSDGWYMYYTYTIPSSAPILWERLWPFVTDDIAGLAGWLIPVLGIGFCIAIARRRIDLLPLLLFPFALGMAMVPRLSPGGFANVFVTMAAFVGIGTGLSLWLIADYFGARSGYNQVALALVLLHFFVRIYDPRQDVALSGNLKEGMAVVEKIRALPGPVLCPYHPYLLHLAGHQMHMNFHMADELWFQRRTPSEYSEFRKLEASVLALLKQRHWKAYVSTQLAGGQERFTSITLPRVIAGLFREGPKLLDPRDRTTLFPATGNRVRPYRVYLAEP